MTQTPPQINVGRQIVLDAVIDLHNQEQIVTTDILVEVTGLKKVSIHEHIKILVEDEKIRRVKDGVFVPMVTPPATRAISVTKIPESFTLVEIGDMCLEIWPREERLLGSLLAGACQQYSNIQAGNEMGVIVVEMASRMKKLERELAAYRSKKGQENDDQQEKLNFGQSK